MVRKRLALLELRPHPPLPLHLIAELLEEPVLESYWHPRLIVSRIQFAADGSAFVVEGRE